MGRAILVIDERVIADMLRVPSYLKVRGLSFDPLRNAVVMHLEGDALEDVPLGTIPPQAQVEAYQHYDQQTGRVSHSTIWKLPLKPTQEQKGGTLTLGEGVIRQEDIQLPEDAPA